MNLFGAKDALIANALKAVANHFLSDYGKIRDFRLDSKTKEIKINIMLDGEREELFLEATDYRVVKRGDIVYLTLGKIHTSRKWVNTLIAKRLSKHEIKFEIPGKLAKAVEVLL